jgi:hypothetical protein
MEQWLLEARDEKLVEPTLKKNKFLPDYLNTANLILYIIKKADTGIFLNDLTISTALHYNTVAIYCRTLANLNLIRTHKIGI